MARKKLSEFTAKTLLFSSLGTPYNGIPVILGNGEQANLKSLSTKLDSKKLYVVKVDQGVKGRMKKGLVGLRLTPKDIPAKIQEFSQKGYSQFLIEEFMPHDSSEERFVSIERTREGITVYYARVGGIDIEQNQDKINKDIIQYSAKNDQIIKKISEVLGVSPDIFQNIVDFFNNQYISFLEINPLVIQETNMHLLDLAVEVDSAAEFFVQNGWKPVDFVGGSTQDKTEEEKNIIALQANSQASLKMEMLNPNGSIFVMLFGGGGSIVVADEIYNQGKSKELANYSDYSGGPREDETVIYVENLLKALLASKAKKKAFVIAGTYANFTDVSVTFRGVIKAMEKLKDELKAQNIKVFVRRPGPNQKVGLALIKEYLEKENMNGGVWDSSMVLSDIVLKAIEYLQG